MLRLTEKDGRVRMPQAMSRYCSNLGALRQLMNPLIERTRMYGRAILPRERKSFNQGQQRQSLNKHSRFKSVQMPYCPKGGQVVYRGDRTTLLFIHHEGRRERASA